MAILINYFLNNAIEKEKNKSYIKGLLIYLSLTRTIHVEI